MPFLIQAKGQFKKKIPSYSLITVVSTREEIFMKKNVQVIDGAINSTFEIYRSEERRVGKECER